MMKKICLILIVLLLSTNLCFAFELNFNGDFVGKAKKVLSKAETKLSVYKQEWGKKLNQNSSKSNNFQNKDSKLQLRTYDFKTSPKNDSNLVSETKDIKNPAFEKKNIRRIHHQRGMSNFSYDEKYLLYGRYTQDLQHNYNYGKDAKLNSNL